MATCSNSYYYSVMHRSSNMFPQTKNTQFLASEHGNLFNLFLFLTATRVSLSLRPSAGAGGGGCDMSWRRRNNPRKSKKGWGANPYPKSAKEKRLKSISVSFITRWHSCWEIKAFKRSRLTVGSPTRDSRQHSFQHVFFFFSPLEGIRLWLFFRLLSISPTAAIIAHPTVWLLKMRDIL